MMTWIKQHATKGRIIIAALVLAVAGYVGYRHFTTPQPQTRYVAQTAEKGLFINSLSGTGQVASQNQVDIKPTVSGQVINILVKDGQTVKQGDPMLALDPKDGLTGLRDAGQNVRDAQISLEASKLSLAKLKAPPTASELVQAEDGVADAQRALAKLQEPPNAYDLQQAQAQVDSAQQNAKLSADGKTPQIVRNAYDNLATNLIATESNLENHLSDVDSILAVDNTSANASFSNLLSVLDTSQKLQAIADYGTAKAAVKNSKTLVDALNGQGDDPQAVDQAQAAAQDALNKMDTLLTSTSRVLLATITSSSFTQNSLDSLKSMIEGDRSDVTSKLSSLLSQTQAVITAKNTYTTSGISLKEAQIALAKLQQPPDQKDVDVAQELINEKQQALADLKAGPTTIDIQIAQNSIEQRQSALVSAQNKLTDAQKTLDDYTVRAPFDGVIAKVDVQKADQASAGTAVVTMIANQQIADITLNEVDAAKVSVGQKATLTFDAIDGLSITGSVEEVSTLGTVTQGVVNYDVKIGFDTQDKRVRPGMSVAASIITDTEPDVILVPNAAIKSDNSGSYVSILDNASSTQLGSPTDGTVHQQPVQTGAANDTETVITQGLSGGEAVVTQTITTTPGQTGTANRGTTSLIPGLGGNATFRGAGGGGFGGGGAGRTGGGSRVGG